jgi:putative ABC transport system substrate-binding protein
MSAYLLALSTLPPGAPAALLLTNRFGGAFFCVGQAALAYATMPGYAHNLGVICYPEISLSSGLGGHMRRRDFITVLGGAVAWPLAARAQQPRRIGWLVANYAQTDREGQANIAAFLDTFQRLGWTDGRNVRMEYRWGAGDADRIQASASELVRSAPDVIVVVGGAALAELHRLTSTIPIVFAQHTDPVDTGIVASLARPGGNITGFQSFEPAVGGKWLGVLREAAPNLRRVAVLFGSDSASNVAFLRAAEAVAPSLGVAVTAVDVHNGGEIERAITTFASQADGGLIVVPHPYTIANRASIIILAAGHHLPAIYPYRYFATEGGLISYGPDQIDQWRRAATYVDRILWGEKPGELPVQAPTKFELVINMKTAKALGLSIPPGLPLRADEVIE